jgi:fido (protein-threonine AMPylation protein)
MVDDASELRSLAGEAQIRATGIAHDSLGPQSGNRLRTQPITPAVRFDYRLVSIHPFANGDGQHSRTMTDLLLAHHGAARFSWGGANPNHAIDARQRYLQALRNADQADYGPLLRFV